MLGQDLWALRALDVISLKSKEVDKLRIRFWLRMRKFHLFDESIKDRDK